MAIEVVMPQMGADMTEGTLVRWLKNPGDSVARGDVIAEIETDKATVELEAFDAGVLRQVVASEGDVVPVGEVIALLGDADEEMPEVERRAPSEKPTPRAVAAPTADGTGGDLDARRVRVSPVARRIADDAGIDLAEVTGSGPDGRILRRDVEEAIAVRDHHAPAGVPTVEPAPPPPPPPPARVEPLSRMRAAIARNMTDAKQQQPHYYLTVDVDMTEAMAFRRHVNLVLHGPERVSVNDLLVRACAVALASHPKFNASLTDEGIQYHEQMDINIGVALDEGLIAPALLDVAAKPLPQIAEESKALVERARAGKLRAEEYSSGTFTITNLGAYGIDVLVGIINAGQAAILGAGSVTERPAVVDGDLAVRQLMTLALSADHRVTDGAEGARFLKEIQTVLENPTRLSV
ncbi:MAG: dihydrolipoamide acetyltransferase family protein [Chloroflexota bacterium]|nr:dihydrolipoamide acetyltransferase family protein [Chloroflexota bacterium]